MKKRLFLCMLAFASILMFGAFPASAEDSKTYGDLNYSIVDNEITITRYTGSETAVKIPDNIDGYPVTTIGEEAFSGRESLSSIVIPDSVTTIGDAAFWGCSSLTKINIPNNVTIIDYAVFSDCTSLSNISIPDSVTSIGEEAFSGCESLSSIVIPDSVTTIGDGAFYFCNSLNIVTLPNSITNIGEFAFYRCKNLTTVLLSGSANRDAEGSNIGIGWNAFADCAALKSITIPDNIMSIDYGAFRNCISLTDISIPNKVTSIGEDAFANCTSLINISIPSSVTSIDYAAFSDCKSLTNVYISDMEAWLKIKFDGKSSNPLCYAKNFYLKGELVTDLVIPQGITAINDYAFYGNTNLKSVIIPEGVTTIGDGAFWGCSYLSSITIPSSVTSIGYAPFYGCADQCEQASLYISDMEAWLKINSELPIYFIETLLYLNGELITDLTIPQSISYIRDYAFYGCTNLKNVIIPEGITTIGGCAFIGCTALTSITIPNSVTAIGDGAFCSCSALTDISVDTDNPLFCSFDGNLYNKDKSTLIQYAAGKNATEFTVPSSVTAIGDCAFIDCSALTNITIPSSVTTIGNGAFECCSALTSITIPNSVTNIGDRIFVECTALTTIYYTGTKNEWDNLGIDIDYYPPQSVNIIYMTPTPKGTTTDVSADGKSFTIKPVNITDGNLVILSLYNGNKLVEIKTADCDTSEILITTDKEYTNAKVMIWKSLDGMTPVYGAEKVK